MQRRLKLPVPRLPPSKEETARDWLAQAQAALGDEQPRAALRALGRIQGLIVPLLDRLLPGRDDGGGAETALSSAVGLPGLWRELPDLDIERASASELLLFYAAQAPPPDPEAPLCPVADDEGLAAQWAWIEAQLLGEPLPRPRWWRRLVRSAAGGLGDRARVQVQRGPLILLERLPPAPDAPDDDDGGDEEAGLFETDIGALAAGDRLTLQIQAPLPGRVAVLHAGGGEDEAALEVLLPAGPAEEAPRRALEVIEISGEVAAVEGAEAQALVVLWGPELLPAGWYRQVPARRRLPPEARLWRYRYRVL